MLKELIFGEEGARLLDEKPEQTHQLLQHIDQGLFQGKVAIIERQFCKKFHQDFDEIRPLLNELRQGDLLGLGEYLLDCESVDELRHWIEQRRHENWSIT